MQRKKKGKDIYIYIFLEPITLPARATFCGHLGFAAFTARLRFELLMHAP